MLVKSKIQLIRETLEIVNNFEYQLKDLMDKYMIEDSIFIYKNGHIYEATQGYFEVIKESQSLEDIFKEYINDLSYGIRVQENNNFQIGKITKRISECDESKKIFDIDYLKEI